MVFSSNISSLSYFLLLRRLSLRLTGRTFDLLQFTFNFRNYKTFRMSGRGIGATYNHYLHWATNKTKMHNRAHYPSGIRTHDTRIHLRPLWSPPIKFFDYTFVGISDFPRPSSLPLFDFTSLPPNTYFTRLPSLKQLITVKYETAFMYWVHSFLLYFGYHKKSGIVIHNLTWHFGTNFCEMCPERQSLFIYLSIY
jgi:hypothetical protein